VSDEILAIDPGADQAYAIYDSSGTLSSCGLGMAPDRAFRALIIETPQVYKVSKAPASDIVTLAIRAGIAIGRQNLTREVFTVTPHTWKGDTPKGIHNARILAKLRPIELEALNKCKGPAGKKHNVIDAIGIGQWFLANRGMWPRLKWNG
jgi:hypothetical protein